jgi:PAS domain S-box-containing protein
MDPRLFQLLVEQTQDYALFLLDEKGHVTSWNRGAQRIKGYAAEEIIGRHFSVFYGRDSVERGWPDYELKVAAIEGRFEDEGWRIRKDDSRFWASVVITALRDEDGRLLGFSKITRDLTERKLHEESLLQSEERFRLLVDGVLEYAIFMLDPDGIVASWNAGAERIKGYRRDEILGRHFSRFYPEEDIQAGKPWEELANARRTGRSEAEGWRVRKDGSRFWARAVLSAVHDSEGRLRGFAKVTQDLSERRQLHELELAAKNVSEFIAMLAHELRNPLAPIRNAIAVMAADTTASPTQVALRETLERQSGQLARIVDDMLDISRISRGTLSLEMLPLDLADVVDQAVETSRPAIEEARHILEVDLPAEPVRVLGDRHRLTQLLSNVLNNAARYTPAGGRISIRARSESANAMVTVSDNGRGINPLLIERIFDMFVQGRSPMERVGSGLGIGLALSRRIAEMHGGTITAASEGEGKGSEFTLRLPLLATHPAAPMSPEETKVGHIAARRVLVVDDNSDAALTLSLLLESLGHETCVAHDGAEALRLAPEFAPDVVFLDLGMPGLNGFEVARRMRRLQRDRPLIIVAVTGWGQEADRKRSEEAGFDVHLVKPVDPETLVKVLHDRGDGTLH